MAAWFLASGSLCPVSQVRGHRSVAVPEAHPAAPPAECPEPGDPDSREQIHSHCQAHLRYNTSGAAVSQLLWLSHTSVCFAAVGKGLCGEREELRCFSLTSFRWKAFKG